LILCKAPLFVEGWDEALHEVGRLSFSTVLPSKRAADLLRSVEDLPVLVVAGSEDALVSVKSAQAMALKLVNSVSNLLPFVSRACDFGRDLILSGRYS